MPFAPGQSPYRAKGIVFQGLFGSTDERCPGGVAAVMARILDPELRAFFEQRFLASSLYDLLPIVPFGQTAALLAGAQYVPYVREGARWQANRDVHGIYRALLKLASPRMVCERLPRITMQYFDFGEATGQFTGDRRYEIGIRGLPRPLAIWLYAAVEGFVPVPLEIAGAKHVILRTSLEPSGRSHGDLELMNGRTVVTWT